jgi:hypothetical protein
MENAGPPKAIMKAATAALITNAILSVPDICLPPLAVDYNISLCVILMHDESKGFKPL